MNSAQTHLNGAETDCEIEEVVADKGYHSEDSIDRLQNDSHHRTYIPESERKTNRTWKNKPESLQAAHRRNRRNTRGARGRSLQRLRSERAERTFAHLCDTGGARRTWIRGLHEVRKRYMTAAMAYNLGRIMRSMFGAGKPRYLAVLAERCSLFHFVMEWCRGLLRPLIVRSRAFGQ